MLLINIIQVKYLNNNIFRITFIGGINSITNAIIINIISVKTLRTDWLYIYIPLYRDNLY